MTAFISSLSDLVALFFNLLRLQAVLPALVFTTANVVLVLPRMRDTWLGELYYAMPDTERVLCAMLATIFLAYFLNIINFTLVRWLEGYPWLQSKLGQHWQKKHSARYDELKRLYDSRPIVPGALSIAEQPMRPQENTPDPNTITQAIAIDEFVMCYPTEKSQILPTRFGNIIASAEDYPNQMYKINAVALWPLLAPILAKTGYAKFIEYEKAALDFVINALVLTPLFGGELLVVGILNHVRYPYLLAELLAFTIVTFLLYELSLSGAVGWGLTIRTAFDLHREELRRAASIKQSDSFEQERLRWELFSEFLASRDFKVAHNRLFQYPVPKGCGAAVFSQGPDATS